MQLSHETAHWLHNKHICVCRLTLSVQRADLTVSFTAHYTEGFKGCSLILSDILSIITQNEKSTEQLALISTFIVEEKNRKGWGVSTHWGCVQQILEVEVCQIKITSFTTCNAGDIFFLILPLDAVYIYSRVTLISPPYLKDFNLITLNGN